MKNDELQNHINRFFAPIDHRGSVVKVMHLISDAAKRDANVGAAVGLVRELIRAPIDAESLKKYREMRTSVPETGSIKIGEGRCICLAVGYLRAKATLENPIVYEKLREKLRNGKDFHAFVKKTLDRTGSKFIGELLVESERRASQDRAFRSRINDALREIEGLVHLGPASISIPPPKVSPPPPPLPKQDAHSDDGPWVGSGDGGEVYLECSNGGAFICAAIVIVIIAVASWL